MYTLLTVTRVGAVSLIHHLCRNDAVKALRALPRVDRSGANVPNIDPYSDETIDARAKLNVKMRLRLPLGISNPSRDGLFTVIKCWDRDGNDLTAWGERPADYEERLQRAESKWAELLKDEPARWQKHQDATNERLRMDLENAYRKPSILDSFRRK